MPIYRYRCPDCQKEVEIILTMQDRDKPQFCDCGSSLRRMMSVMAFKIKTSGRDTVLNTLNREYKTLPPEQVNIMAPGLNRPPRPVIGRGF